MRKAPPFSESADDLETPDRPSKSALKRQMHDLQALGQELSELPASRVQALDLPESLRDALHEFHRTRSHEGRRRQLQFIGKLMRQTDDGPIREAVAAFKLGSARDTLALHQAERWREELLTDDEALTRWMAQHPASDLRQLRDLVRAARKTALADSVEQRHGRAYRDLFQLIKTTLAAAATPAGAATAEEDDDHEQ